MVAALCGNWLAGLADLVSNSQNNNMIWQDCFKSYICGGNEIKQTQSPSFLVD